MNKFFRAFGLEVAHVGILPLRTNFFRVFGLEVAHIGILPPNKFFLMEILAKTPFQCYTMHL